MKIMKKQTIPSAAFESMAAFLWIVLLLALIGLLVSLFSGCAVTGDPATDFKNAGDIAEKIGEATPAPVGSWIELGAGLLTSIGVLLAQQKRVVTRDKKIKELECEVCDLNENKGA